MSDGGLPNGALISISYYDSTGIPVGVTPYIYPSLTEAIAQARVDFTTGLDEGFKSGRILQGLHPKNAVAFVYLQDNMTSIFERLDSPTGVVGPL